MKNLSPTSFATAHGPGTRLARGGVRLLSLLTLAVAGLALWLVDRSVRTEQLAARQRWTEAAQLRLSEAALRLRDMFQSRSTAVDQLSEHPPATAFHKAVHSRLADSIVWRPAGKSPGYPQLVIPWNADAEEPTGWQEAQTQIQQQVKFLAENNVPAALEISRTFFALPAHRALTSPSGRMLGTASDLLLLQQPAAVPAWLKDRLVAEAKDYGQHPLPAPQRRLIMSVLGPEHFPTYAAETLAASYLQAQAPQTLVSWTPQGSRATLLFQRSTFVEILAKAADTPGITFSDLPNAASTSQNIHPDFPAWKMAFTGPEAAENPQIRLYGWLGIAFVGLLGLLTWLTSRYVNRQLEKAQLQQDLAASVSHELKTPVASMRLLVESLREDPVLDETKTREYLELLAKENQRLSRLIDNCLTLAKLEQNSPVGSTSSLAGEILQNIEKQAISAGFADRLHITATSPESALRGDSALIEMALLNLLDNAAKYATPGTHIQLKQTLAGQHVHFTVENEGPPLSSAELGKIWQPFERLPRHASQPGCGLGLAIVHRIAQQAGGSVVAASTASGIAFTLLLPIHAN